MKKTACPKRLGEAAYEPRKATQSWQIDWYENPSEHIPGADTALYNTKSFNIPNDILRYRAVLMLVIQRHREGGSRLQWRGRVCIWIWLCCYSCSPTFWEVFGGYCRTFKISNGCFTDEQTMCAHTSCVLTPTRTWMCSVKVPTAIRTHGELVWGRTEEAPSSRLPREERNLGQGGIYSSLHICFAFCEFLLNASDICK